jgi:excisionase family DNA binding protein
MTSESIDDLLAGRALLSVADAAEVMSVTRQHLYNCIARGSVPSVKIGGCVRVPTDYIRELMTVGQQA